jgi:hypothetical protein
MEVAMNELGPRARALLDVARDGDGPTDAARARVRASITRRLAIGVAAGTAAATVAKTAGAGAVTTTAAIAAPIGLGMKVLVTLAIATAVGMGAVTYVDSQPHTAPAAKVAPLSRLAANAASPPKHLVPEAPHAAQAEPPSAPAAPESSAVSPPMVAAAPSHTAVAAASASAPAPVDSSAAVAPLTVKDEIALIGRAHAALTAGDPSGAIALLDEHAREFPKGALGEEREATRVLALCALGRTAAAHSAADRFFAAFPGGPQAGRVRASCGGAPSAN